MNYFEENIDLYLKQFKELRKYYPKLKDQIRSENLLLRGEVCFNEDFGTGFLINDCYLIEIEFSPNYPNLLPTVKEIGGKIESDYPHFNKNGTRTLCLGTNVDLWLRFSKIPTILNFVCNLLVPSLYAHGYWKRKDKKMPWGDRRHGSRGIADFYADLFQVYDLYQIIQLLSALLYLSFDWNSQCPCGRGMSLNECHRIRLKKLKSVPRKYLLYEANCMSRDYFKIYRERLGKKQIDK